MRTKTFLIMAIVLAACGGGETADTGEGVASLEESSTTTTAAETEEDPEATVIAFTECMRENGIDMEDPTVDADGNVMPGRPTDLPDPEENGGSVVIGPADLDEELRAAFEACGELLEGTAFGFSPEDQTELEDQLLALAECLRDQGLEVADPDLSSLPEDGPRGEGGPFGIDFQDPEVQAAMEQCEDLVPGFAGGPDSGEFRFNAGGGPTQSGDDDDQ